MTKHYNITVYGRVQGVGYRYETERQARYMGIKGYVKNKRDGSVFIEAEGEEDILNHFVRWCHDGPRYARVEEVIKEEGPVIGMSGFSVTY